MLGITQSAALVGVDAHPVQVEVNTGEAGELKFILVGLPDAAVKESQDRVFSAMANSGFRTPATRTTINLAPGGLRKEGPAYDLPIALAILASMKKCEDTELDHFLIAGELSLSGQSRFRVVCHADNGAAPAPIEHAFGTGREGGALHAEIRSSAMQLLTFRQALLGGIGQ